MNTLKLLGLAVVVAALAAAWGCDRSAPTTGPAGADKKLRIAFLTNNASDFWTIARAGCTKAAEETPNVEVDFRINSDPTAAGQKRVVDDLLARGIDGLAISPVDPANQTQMLNDVARQAVLFTQDSDAPKTDRVCYIGTNNTDAGKQAGELIKKALPNGGKIMVFVGSRDAQNARERFDGIQQALKGSAVEVIDVRTDETDRVRAKANVQDTLVKYPDVACLVGLWSYNGPAIVNAVTESGKAGKVKVVCFDEEDETLAGVKAGVVDATVVQQPYEFGRQAIALIARYKRGDVSVVPASRQIFVPTLSITKENVGEFSTKLKGLRGR